MSGAKRFTATTDRGFGARLTRTPGQSGPAFCTRGAMMQITVLGAGVAGLAVATALAKAGHRVQVLEQAGAIREVGAGLQISPNGAVVLKALGVAVRATRAQAVTLRNGADGRRVLRLDLARLRPDQEYLFAHRADLIEALQLAAVAAGVQIGLGRKVLAVDLSGDRPRLTTDQAEMVPDLLIGADGLHSLTRAALNGPETPFFTGQIAWRALIPCEQGAPEEAEVFMGPGRHLVSYPLRGGTLRNIVAVEERAKWTQESWSLRDDPTELRRAFEAFDPKVRHWLNQVDDVGLWGLFRHRVAETWGRALPMGGAVILGDAVHPTLPFLAQGASMALEDAFVLARALTGVQVPGPSRDLRDTGFPDPSPNLRANLVPGLPADLARNLTANLVPDLASALAAYQSLRQSRVTRIVQAANANARAYHLREPLRAFAHLGLRVSGRLAPGFALSRFDWLYGHDVTA